MGIKEIVRRTTEQMVHANAIAKGEWHQKMLNNAFTLFAGIYFVLTWRMIYRRISQKGIMVYWISEQLSVEECLTRFENFSKAEQTVKIL